MSELHHQELEELKRLFEELSLGRLEDRLSVVEAFLATDDHLSAAELTARLAGQGHDLAPDLVQGTLELLVRLGFAQKKEFTDRDPVYEHRHLGDHHDHLVCLQCGQIVEFCSPDLEHLQQAIARQRGFRLLSHRHQLYGLCPKCGARRQPCLPLALARPGEKLEVVGYMGGRRAQAHLADMGLTPGSEVEVLCANGGPLVVACRGSRLALGRQLAMKLSCRAKDDAGSSD